MSTWQAYIDSMEKGNGKCKYAALVGIEGGISVWSESTNKDFCLSPDEMNRVFNIIKNKEDDIMTNGIELHGAKFTCLRREDDILVMQGKENFKDYSLVVATSSRVMLIGCNPQSEVKAANVRDGVEAIRDYLKNQGF